MLYQERSKRSSFLKHSKAACESTNNCKRFKENERYEELQHIQGQIKSVVAVCQLLYSGVSATRAFKSNIIRIITSQSVVRSVKHGISDKHKQLKQERAESRFRVRYLFFWLSGNSSPSRIEMCVCLYSTLS